MSQKAQVEVELIPKIDKAKKALKDLERQIEKDMRKAGIKGGENFSKGFNKQLEKITKGLDRKLKQVEKDMQKTGLRGGRSFSKGFNKQLEKVTNGLDKKLKPSLSRIENRFSGLDSTISGVGQNGVSSLAKVGGFIGGSAFAGAIATATVGVIALAGAFGTLATTAVPTAANFEVAMNKVSALTGASREQFDALEKSAREMGASTVFSATQAAEAQAFLGIAGFKTNEILSATPEILNLAIAGQLELGRSADIVSNIMGQFGIEAEDTNRVVDVLAATASSSNTSIEQLGQAMKYLGPTAKSLGISIEDTAAVVGVLGDAGIQGSLAGRALGSALVRLSDPTEKMAVAMDRMGVSAFNAQGKFVGMPSLLEQIEEGTRNMSDEQRNANLYALLGAEAFQEIGILLERGSGAYTEYAKSITDTNKAQEMANTMQGGLSGSWRSLMSAIEEVQLTLMNDFLIGGKPLIEWLAIATQTVTGFIRGFDFQPLFTALGIGFQVLYEVFQPFMDVMTAWFAGEGKDALDAFMTETWAGLQEGFLYFQKEILPGLVIAMENFALFFVETMLPLIQNAWTQISEHILPKILPALKLIIDTFNLLWPVVEFALSTVLNGVNNLYSVAYPIFGFLADVVIGFGEIIAGVLGGDVSRITDGATLIFDSFKDTIVDIFNAMANGAIDSINTIINAINGLLSVIPDDIPLLGGASISTIPGFSRGGYTGEGDPNEVAGLVHKDEYVFNSQIVNKVGVDNLATLARMIMQSPSQSMTDNRDMSTTQTTNVYGLQTANDFI